MVYLASSTQLHHWSSLMVLPDLHIYHALTVVNTDHGNDKLIIMHFLLVIHWYLCLISRCCQCCCTSKIFLNISSTRRKSQQF